MKKALSLLIVCFLLCIITATPVLAAEGKISAEITTNDKTQNRITVELSIDNNPGFIAIQPRLEYDSKVLKLTSADNGEIFNGIYMKGQHQSAVPYDLIFMDATASENITKTGVLAKYTFEVISNVNETEIKLSINDVSIHGLGKNKPTFNGCSVTVKLSDVSTLPPAQNKPTVSNNEQSTTTSSVQNGNSIQNGNQSNGNQSNDNQSNDNPQSTSNNGLSEKTIILIISLVAVVILGGAITGFAIYVKNKKQK